jgi:putative DNA primase/helicase
MSEQHTANGQLIACIARDIEKYGAVILCNGKGATHGWKNLSSHITSVEQAEELLVKDSRLNQHAYPHTHDSTCFIDADSLACFEKFKELCGKRGVGRTLTVETSPGRYHIIFKQMYSQEHAEVLWKDADGKELKFVPGHYTRLPGPNNQSRIVDDSPPAEMPLFLAYELTNIKTGRMMERGDFHVPAAVEPPHDDEVDDLLAAIPPDCDWETWWRVGSGVKSLGYSIDRFIAWSESAPGRLEPGSAERVWGMFDGRIRGGTLYYIARQHGWKSKRRRDPLTPLGASRTLAREAAGKFKHHREHGWLVYDGRVWVKDGGKGIIELQKTLLEERRKEISRKLYDHNAMSSQDYEKERAARGGDGPSYGDRKDQLDGALKAVKRLEDTRVIVGVTDLTETDPLIDADRLAFDAHPHLLNCPNGTLDLWTGELRQHDPADLLTQMCKVAYRPEAMERFALSRWAKWLQEVFQGDADLIGFVKRSCGYFLDGIVREQVFWIWYGLSRNGKSTLARVLYKWTLGSDYACVLPSGFFRMHKFEQHPAKLVVLHGKRVVFDVETPKDMPLDTPLLKRLTGGDEVQDRGMRENFARHDTTAKFVIYTNHRPQVPENDKATFDRLREVPFDVSFLGKEELGLDEKLEAEAEIILAWMVEGHREWLHDGLGTAPAVTKATDENVASHDTVRGFLDEMCEFVPDAQPTKRSIIDAYGEWCRADRKTPVSDKQFGITLTILHPEIRKNKTCYIGMRLKPEEQQKEDQRQEEK